MNKRFFALLLLAAILALSGCGTSPAVTETGAPPSTVASFGEAPARYKGAVLEKELLKNASAVSDGYLLYGDGAEKYDRNGRLLWKKEYPHLINDERGATQIVPGGDGSFFIVQDIGTYQENNSQWIVNDPYLTKCDKDGKLIWQKRYEGFGRSDSTIREVFILDNGNILTVGTADKEKTSDSGGKDFVYLSLLNRDGKLLKEKYYGGSDYEWVNDADYSAKAGLITTVFTQSADGTFAASEDGEGVCVLLSIDDSLNIRWQKEIKNNFADRSVVAADQAIYLLDLSNDYSKFDFDGNTLFSIKLCDTQQHAYLIGTSKCGLVFQTGDTLKVYNDEDMTLKIILNAGTAESVIDTDGGFVVASTHVTGVLPTPITLNSGPWHSTELVYSGYDDKGRLLWRGAVDNTPEYMKNYKDSEQNTER